MRRIIISQTNGAPMDSETTDEFRAALEQEVRDFHVRARGRQDFIRIRVDRWTASLSLGRCRVTSEADDPMTPENKGKAERVRINYWDLYVRR